jgi:putative DNA primase/helicase
VVVPAASTKPLVPPQVPKTKIMPSDENGYLSEDAMGDPNRPRAPKPGDIVTYGSDMCIAEAVKKSMVARALYLEDERRWIVWQGEELAWSYPGGDRVARTWIRMGIQSHVEKHFSQHPEGTLTTLMSAHRVDAVERLLRDDLGYRYPADHTNRFYLQTPDGAYDLRNGSKVEIDTQRRLLEMRRTDVAPRDVPTPEFDRVVDLMCGHDPNVVDWLWHYLGYLLLGNPIGHNFLIIHGPGGNGKGSFCRTIQRVVGSYALEARRELILESGKKDHKTALRDLKGKRLWFISEISENEKWHEAQLKALTGGDKVQANKMHHDDDHFIAEGSFIVATNNIPKNPPQDDAMKRRTLIIAATEKPLVRDLNIEERIVNGGELEGILFRMIRTAAIVYKNGHMLPQTPRAMTRATDAYFEDQDTFGQWMEECCAVGLSLRAKASEVLLSYNRWLAEQNKHGIDSTTLKTALTKIAGISHKREAGGAMFLGFALIPAEGDFTAVE